MLVPNRKTFVEQSFSYNFFDKYVVCHHMNTNYFTILYTVCTSYLCLSYDFYGIYKDDFCKGSVHFIKGKRSIG